MRVCDPVLFYDSTGLQKCMVHTKEISEDLEKELLVLTRLESLRKSLLDKCATFNTTVLQWITKEPSYSAREVIFL